MYQPEKRAFQYEWISKDNHYSGEHILLREALCAEGATMTLSSKTPARPAHESIQRKESEKDDKAQEVANKAAEKAGERMKQNEDSRGPFSK